MPRRARELEEALESERAQRAGEACAKLRALLTEHRWADAASLLEEVPPDILGGAEEAEGKSKGWTPLHTACHRPVPADLLDKIVAAAPAAALNLQTAGAQSTPLHLAVSTGKEAAVKAPPARARAPWHVSLWPLQLVAFRSLSRSVRYWRC